jgi:hypothetical protein
MWEGDPVGVDQKRPLVGFALVSVLCAVLMGLSIGKSSGIDIFKPARPIAAPAEHRAHEPARTSEREQQPRVVSLPAELSPQPVGSASGSLVVQRDDESSTTSLEVEETREVEESSEKGAGKAVEKAAAKAEKAADRAAAKAERDAAKAARKAEHEATKAAAKAEREAAKAAREAEREAAKAVRDAAKAAAAAEREAAKAAREAERQAAQAVRDAAKLARKAAHAAR